MKRECIRPISQFIAIIFHNYILFKFFLIRNIYDKYGNMSYLYIIILMLITFLICLSINRKKANGIYNLVMKKWYIKYPLIVYFVISNILVGIMAIRIIEGNFFNNYNVLLFVATLFFSTFIMSKIKTTGIINILTIPACFYFLFFLITNIINYDIKDYTLLLPFEYIKVPSLKIITTSIFLIIDNCIFFLLRKDAKEDLSPRTLFFAIFIWLSLVLVEVINITALAGYNYLYGYEYIGFLSYAVQQTFKYIGNFEFVYIYLITMFSVFKITFNITLMKELNNKISSIMFVIIPLAVYILLLNYELFIKNVMFFIVLGFICFIPYFISLYIGDNIEKD